MAGHEPRASLTISVSHLGELDGGIQQHLAAALGLALVPAERRRRRVRCVSGVRGAGVRRVPLQLQGVEEALADLPDGAVVLAVLRHLPQQLAHRLLQLVHRLEVRPAAVQDPCGHTAPALHIPLLSRQVAPSRSLYPTRPWPPVAIRALPPVATAGRCRDMLRRGRLSHSWQAGTAHPSRKRKARRPSRGTRSEGCRRRTPWRGRPAPRSRRRRSKPERTPGAAGKEAGGRHGAGAAGRCSPDPTAPAHHGASNGGPSPRAETAAPAAIGTSPKPAQPLLVLSPRGKGFGRTWNFFLPSFKSRVSGFKPQSRHCRLGFV